jgi:hypothetical protein
VHLVDEQDDGPGGVRHLAQHRLEALLELAAILGPGDQRAHVQRHQLLVGQAFRHVAIDDAQRQPLGDGGLADPGLADQHRIVLGPAAQHLDGAPDLLVAPDHRVQLAFARRLGQVASVFLQRVVTLLGRSTIGRAPLPQIVDRGIQRLRLDPGAVQHLGRLGALGQRDRGKHPLGADETVARLGGDLLRLVQQPGQARVHIDLIAAARDLGQPGDRRIHPLLGRLGIAARGGDQVGRQPLLVIQQRFEQMFGGQPLVPLAQRNGLCRLQEPARAVGELFQVHMLSPQARLRLTPIRHAAHRLYISGHPLRHAPQAMWAFNPLHARPSLTRVNGSRI